MAIVSPLGKWQKIDGLLAAAVAAWALTTLVDIGWPMLSVWFASTFLGYDGYVPSAGQVGSFVAAYVVFGLPLAMVVCLAAGLPAWRFAERRGLETWIDALKVGGVVALVVGATGIVLGVLASLPTALSDNSAFDSWSWGYQIVRDGLPTPLGWAFTAIDLLATVGIGCIAGLVAWAVAGAKPKTSAPS